jgi:hypothetical protein
LVTAHPYRDSVSGRFHAKRKLASGLFQDCFAGYLTNDEAARLKGLSRVSCAALRCCNRRTGTEIHLPVFGSESRQAALASVPITILGAVGDHHAAHLTASMAAYVLGAINAD